MKNCFVSIRNYGIWRMAIRTAIIWGIPSEGKLFHIMAASNLPPFPPNFRLGPFKFVSQIVHFHVVSGQCLNKPPVPAGIEEPVSSVLQSSNLVSFYYEHVFKLPRQMGLLFMQPDWVLGRTRGISICVPRQGRLSAVGFYSTDIRPVSLYI